jgi:two-component system CheB/CheR fusion protein
LSISKSLVEMMGGTIWADSKVGKGSTFYFTAVFGLAEELAQSEPERLPDAPSPSGALRILLAEDNTINQIFMVTLLKQQGHYVEVAENGFESITKLEAGDFDLVLMDELMPEMSGTEAIAAIRSGAAGPDKAGVKVVALTAQALKGDRERFLAAGMDDYLSKPFTMEDLASVIDKMSGKQPD